MAITKIQSGAIPADAIDTTHIGDVGADKITGQVVSSQISDLNVTHAKLHTTMDLSSKTVTLPTLSSLNVNDNNFDISAGTGNAQIKVITASGDAGIELNAGNTQPWYIYNQINDFRIRSDNTDYLSIATNGNVGVGTDSPGAKLHVNGASARVQVSDTGTSFTAQDFLSNSNAVRATIGVERSSGGGLFVGSSAYAAVFGTASNGATQFATNNNVRMTLDTSGNVGIGTTSPSAKLTITDEDSGQAMLQVRNFHTGATGSFGGAHSVELRSATSTTTHGVLIHHNENSISRRSLDVSDSNGIFASFVQGKVGIGTASPNSPLHVHADGIGIRLDGSTNTTRKIFFRSTSTTNPAEIYADGTLKLWTEDPNTNIILDPAGKVGIGTASPAAKLHVEGTIYADNGTTVKSVTTVGTGVGGVPRQRFHRLINQGAGQQKVLLMRYGRHWWGVGWFEIIIRGTYYGGNSKYGVFTVNGHTRSGLASISSHINNSGTAVPFAENYNSTHESCDISINLPGYEYYNIEYNIQHSYQQSAADDVGIHVGNSNAFFLYGTIEEFI